MSVIMCFVKVYGDNRDLHVLTHPFPKRRASDLPETSMGAYMGPITARTALALAPLALFSATPAHAELVNAANPETIKAIVESQGWPATIVAKEGDEPYIESTRNGLKFLVLFINPDAGERRTTPEERRVGQEEGS